MSDPFADQRTQPATEGVDPFADQRDDSDPGTWTDSELVEELLGIESGLNSWELGFVEDQPGNLERYGSLTAGQRKKAIQIIRRKA